MSPEERYEIFQKISDKQVVWVESATSLNNAKLRVTELKQMFPGDYLIFDAESLCFIIPVHSNTSKMPKPS